MSSPAAQGEDYFINISLSVTLSQREREHSIHFIKGI
jgi:hypothetical protein